MQGQAILTVSTPTDVPWNKGKFIGAKPPLRQKHASASAAVCPHGGCRAGVETGRFLQGMRQGLP